MIGHGGLLRAFSFDLPPDMPRRPETWGFAMQFNAETLWRFAQLRYPSVE